MEKATSATQRHVGLEVENRAKRWRMDTCRWDDEACVPAERLRAFREEAADDGPMIKYFVTFFCAHNRTQPKGYLVTARDVGEACTH